jgi:hypothetical protein
MLEAASAQTNYRELPPIGLLHPVEVPKQISNGPSPSLARRNEREEFACHGVLQNQILVMLPHIGGLTIKPFWPLLLVEIAKGVARWHDVAVVEKTHFPVWWLSFAVELDPANQGLVGETDKLCVFGNLLTVVVRDEDPFLRPSSGLGTAGCQEPPRQSMVSVPVRALVLSLLLPILVQLVFVR